MRFLAMSRIALTRTRDGSGSLSWARMICEGCAPGFCHDAGGELEQIQFLLGHVSVQTTEKYLGYKQRLREPVNDRIGIEPCGWLRFAGSVTRGRTMRAAFCARLPRCVYCQQPFPGLPRRNGTRTHFHCRRDGNPIELRNENAMSHRYFSERVASRNSSF